jgi:hypothetical protein
MKIREVKTYRLDAAGAAQSKGACDEISLRTADPAA